jgi:cell division initiation protein
MAGAGKGAGPPRRPGAGRSRKRGAVDEVRDVSFPLTFRGYERSAVDAYVGRVSQLVAELEATQLREGVVQRALDEVGEQTSAVLQQAHEAAEEITSRSRSQAEGRMQHAERDAEQVRAEADEYARQIQTDIRRLRQDRLRLIEEIRRLADEVLGVADDALERLPEPDEEPAPPAGADAGGPPPAQAADGDEPTAEVAAPSPDEPS